MKKRVYIETSIARHLTARPSRDLLAAAWQEITVTWWNRQRGNVAGYPRCGTLKQILVTRNLHTPLNLTNHRDVGSQAKR